MNHHSAKQASMNARRRTDNLQEPELIAYTIQYLLNEGHGKASQRDFSYNLTKAIDLAQREMHITLYPLRDRSVEKIIGKFGRLMMSHVDTALDDNGETILQLHYS